MLNFCLDRGLTPLTGHDNKTKRVVRPLPKQPQRVLNARPLQRDGKYEKSPPTELKQISSRSLKQHQRTGVLHNFIQICRLVQSQQNFNDLRENWVTAAATIQTTIRKR